MKIMFHINSLGLGGAERVVSILAKEFSDFGHEVFIATEWEADKEYPLDQRISRIHVGLNQEDESKGRITIAFLRLFRLRKAIKNVEPDYVISFCNKANFRAAYAMLGIKRRLLVSVRNDPKKDYAPYKFPTSFMTRKAAGCVFQTPDAKAFFDEKLQKKGTIILNPLDDKYANLPERNRIQITEDNKELVTETGREKIIVSVGRISEQKNQLLLVKAFEEVLQKFPEYKLHFYGDVQTEKSMIEMDSYVKEHHLEDSVIFCGSSQKLEEDIRNKALFVLPSNYEGMPNALIEAMVLGLPCISTDCPCGGSRMLIEEGVNGMLVPVKDVSAMVNAMTFLLKNPQKAEKMGLEASKLYERVKATPIAKQWEAFMMKGFKKK